MLYPYVLTNFTLSSCFFKYSPLGDFKERVSLKKIMAGRFGDYISN